MRCRVRLADDPRHPALCEYLGRATACALAEEQATVQALRLLTSAAEFDSATGGVNREANLYPIVKLITEAGVRTVPDAQLKPLYEAQVVRHV